MTRTAAYTPEQLREIYGLHERSLQPSQADPTTVCIEITANLTAVNTPELQAMIIDAIGRGDRSFTLDLTGCPYVDRRGLSGLERVAWAISDRGGELVIANAHKDLKTLFSIKGIAQLVKYQDSGAADVTSYSIERTV